MPAPPEEIIASDGLRWLLGLFVTGFLAAIGQLHVRLNRSDDKLNAMEDKANSSARAGDDAIWTELREHQRSSLAFRETVLTNMVTKVDLDRSEKRILAVLGGRRRHDDVE